jgi:predicted nucleic acid-binding protein
MILECALVAKAGHIISGDKKHLLRLKQFRRIPMVSPAEFLNLHQP